MKIAILGLGGVGGTVAGALAHAEDELITIVRGKTKEAVQERGFLFDSELLGNKVIRPVQVSDDPGEIGMVDILILCCKSYSLQEACEKYQSIVGEDTLIVPLQNGVTAARDISRYLKGKGQIAEGYIYCFSFITEPGHVANISSMLRMGFGFKDGRKNEKAEYLKEMLRKGGMPIAEGQDVLAEIWKKYMMMGGNSVTFLYYDCAAGEIQKDAEKTEFLRSVYEELRSIGIASGVQLGDGIVGGYMEEFMALPPETTSSLYRDVRDGKPQTELDAVVGGGCRLAEELGVDAPCLLATYNKRK